MLTFSGAAETNGHFIIIGGKGGQFWPTPEMAKQHGIVYPEYLEADTPDEIVKAVPEGVNLTDVAQTGARVELRGVAQSSTRVSALMRNIDAVAAQEDADRVTAVRVRHGALSTEGDWLRPLAAFLRRSESGR